MFEAEYGIVNCIMFYYKKHRWMLENVDFIFIYLFLKLVICTLVLSAADIYTIVIYKFFNPCQLIQWLDYCSKVST